jgi:hypothetical protein
MVLVLHMALLHILQALRVFILPLPQEGGQLDSPTPSIRVVPVCPAKEEEEAAAAAITRGSLDIIEACQILDIEVLVTLD